MCTTIRCNTVQYGAIYYDIIWRYVRRRRKTVKQILEIDPDFEKNEIMLEVIQNELK